MPKIEGAIILAEGADDANIKNNIIVAVEAVTGLSTHKIQVFKLGANGANGDTWFFVLFGPKGTGDLAIVHIFNSAIK